MRELVTLTDSKSLLVGDQERCGLANHQGRAQAHAEAAVPPARACTVRESRNNRLMSRSSELDESPARRGTVWMIGGAPGAGKTQVAYLLARELGGAIVEVDDIYLR
jgi:predicted ATP-dependent serine protease